MYSIGDEVEVVNPYANNQAGGTIHLLGTFHAKIVKSWHDYEIGDRYIGELLREDEIEASRQAGKVSFSELTKEYDPRRVYFGQFDRITKG